MKVALVHDYLKEYGGAERVLEALHALYPHAPVFTTVYLPSFLGPHRERFKNWNIKTSWLQYLPFKAKLISPLRALSPFAFRFFNFAGFDVIITSATGAYFPNTLMKGKAVLISYCHTPPRYLYGYATAREWKQKMIFRIIGEVTNHVLRLIDYNASKNVDYYIANSREVAARIKKFYRRDAKVIYPPVDVATALSYFKKQKLVSGLSDRKKKEYFLAGGRLARPKHIDLIVQGCAELGLSLKIFGKSFAGYGKELKHVVLKKNQYLKRLAGRSSEEQNDNNIEFLGEITDEEKWKLMQEAKAFIFASEDEDFGITPVEAMAVGTPVIAYRSGGVKETVIEGKTGVFFDQLTVESLVRALKRFNELNHSIKAEDCRKQAEKFSQERFMSKIKKFISSKYARTS